MKIKNTPMRTVTYLGADVQIPAHHTAVATDGCGQVYSYADTPIEITTCWRSSNSYDSPYKVPARVDFAETVEWRNSLQLYPLAEANKVPAAAHPHAGLMMKYAEIAQTTDKPWEHFELRLNDSCVWEAIHFPLRFYSDVEYRIKPEPPKTIRIGEYDVPEPVREPLEDDKEYWGVDPMAEELAWKYKWKNALFCNLRLRRGLIHLTKEAAVIHAKALLSLTKAAE